MRFLKYPDSCEQEGVWGYPYQTLNKIWEKDLSFHWHKIFNKLPLNIVKSEDIQTFYRRARLFIITLIFYYYFRLKMWFCIAFLGLNSSIVFLQERMLILSWFLLGLLN